MSTRRGELNGDKFIVHNGNDTLSLRGMGYFVARMKENFCHR